MSPYPRIMAWPLSTRREFWRRLRKFARVMDGKTLEAAAHALVGEMMYREMEEGR